MRRSASTAPECGKKLNALLLIGSIRLVRGFSGVPLFAARLIPLSMQSQTLPKCRRTAKEWFPIKSLLLGRPFLGTGYLSAPGNKSQSWGRAEVNDLRGGNKPEGKQRGPVRGHTNDVSQQSNS